MERRKFISNICLGCIGITFGGAALNSCSQMKSVNAFAQEGYLVIDKSEFIDKDSNKEFDSIIITSNSLKEPIILFKTGRDTFEATSLECTHKSVTLDLVDAQLVCSAHGSKFEKNGKVINGPAKRDLKRYSVDKTISTVKIKL